MSRTGGAGSSDWHTRGTQGHNAWVRTEVGHPVDCPSNALAPGFMEPRSGQSRGQTVRLNCTRKATVGPVLTPTPTPHPRPGTPLFGQFAELGTRLGYPRAPTSWLPVPGPEAPLPGVGGRRPQGERAQGSAGGHGVRPEVRTPGAGERGLEARGAGGSGPGGAPRAWLARPRPPLPSAPAAGGGGGGGNPGSWHHAWRPAQGEEWLPGSGRRGVLAASRRRRGPAPPRPRLARRAVAGGPGAPCTCRAVQVAARALRRRARGQRRAPGGAGEAGRPPSRPHLTAAPRAGGRRRGASGSRAPHEALPPASPPRAPGTPRRPGRTSQKLLRRQVGVSSSALGSREGCPPGGGGRGGTLGSGAPGAGLEGLPRGSRGPSLPAAGRPRPARAVGSWRIRTGTFGAPGGRGGGALLTAGFPPGGRGFSGLGFPRRKTG